DLAALDPYFILPVLMTVTMVLQTRMNPTPPDPVQAKVMQFMLFVFSIFFFFFPAGLVLYWLVNNILLILQQWQIRRMFDCDMPAHARRRDKARQHRRVRNARLAWPHRNPAG